MKATLMARIRRAGLVGGVLLGGLVSGSALGAVTLYAVQWILADEPIMAEPAAGGHLAAPSVTQG